jgi:hypothetical protein
MNVFELTFALTILAGLIMGGVAGATFGALGVVLGPLIGVAISLACYFIVLKLSTGLAKVCHLMDAPPKNPLLFIAWWIVNFASVMMIVLAPIATVAILLFVRSRT